VLVLALLFAGLALAATFVLFAYRRGWTWTGFKSPEGTGGKTLWDWLELLVIPVALAGVAFGLNAWQSDRDQRHEDERAARALLREQRTAERERRAATDDRREAVLQGYLREISGLMLHEDLLRSRRSEGVRVVARTATLTALRRLDSARKTTVVRFLAEAGLIREPSPKVPLYGADLRGIVFGGGSDFADFRGALLDGADFGGGILMEMRFDGASLRRAHFDHSDISGATFADAHASYASFRGTAAGIDFGNADLRHADFADANFAGARFDGACVSYARFVRADMHGTRFDAEGEHIDLSGADLRGLRGGQYYPLVDVVSGGARRDRRTRLVVSHRAFVPTQQGCANR
jgi:hypothetical protein